MVWLFLADRFSESVTVNALRNCTKAWSGRGFHSDIALGASPVLEFCNVGECHNNRLRAKTLRRRQPAIQNAEGQCPTRTCPPRARKCCGANVSPIGCMHRGKDRSPVAYRQDGVPSKSVSSLIPVRAEYGRRIDSLFPTSNYSGRGTIHSWSP